MPLCVACPSTVVSASVPSAVAMAAPMPRLLPVTNIVVMAPAVPVDRRPVNRGARPQPSGQAATRATNWLALVFRSPNCVSRLSKPRPT